jgi:beta-phosphoglucomutase-like phosphatase (HAD superfamily)/dTDP-glucose pyrophosphorylase
LDGVLIDSREMHYDALNCALKKVNPEYIISREEHLSLYDGLPTSRKLSILTEEKNLPQEKHNQIWEDKQKATLEIFSNLEHDYVLIHYFQKLKNKGYQVAVASNSIRNTVKLVLLKLGVLEFVDYYVSNEDVVKNKPFPEMYWKCMVACNAIPKTTVIFEDSHIGRQGAIDSGSHLIAIENRNDLTDEKIKRSIEILSENKKISIPWKSDKMNVLIPMAGAGSRFASAGYTFPKPLIEVDGKPMIQVVVENLNIQANYTFIVQKEHYEKYNLQYLLNLIAPNCNIVQVNGLTEGAACTTLLAKEFIDNDFPLVIANSDQFVEWNSNECLYAFNADGIDGGIVSFKATHPKWSYAKIGEDGFVSEVAEKKPISDNATVGIYFWKKGSDYVKYAEQMIEKNIRTNNEFYVCPVFNEAIADGKKIRIKGIERMWGIGTPEDLNYFVFKGSGFFAWLKILDMIEPNTIKKAIGFDFFDPNFVDNLNNKIDKETMKQVFTRCENLDLNDLSLSGIYKKIENAEFKRSKYELIAGDISETTKLFVEERPGFRISILYMDLDIEEPTYNTLNNLWDRVVPGGVVIFDEHTYHSWSESNAVDRFVYEKKLILHRTDVQAPTAYIIK